MKKFTFSGTVLKFAHPETGALVVMHDGDSLTLPDDLVSEFCAAGFGSAEGCETGERDPKTVRLFPPNTTSTMTSGPAGG